MRQPNVIYHFIQQLPAEQKKPFVYATNAKTQRHYFMQALEVPDNVNLLLQGSEHRISQQHLSIDEHCKANDDLFQAYHLTANLQTVEAKPAYEKVLRSYFDQYGFFRAMTLKQNGKRIPLSLDDEKKLKNYAELQTSFVINEINTKIIEKKEKLLKQIEIVENELENLSRDLGDKTTLPSYIKKLKEIIALIDSINPLSRYVLRGKQKIYSAILAFCQEKLLKATAALPFDLFTTIYKSEQRQVALMEMPADQPAKMPESKTAPMAFLSSDTLKAVKKKLASLKTDDPHYVSQKKSLLLEKLGLLPKENFSELIKTYQQLNTLGSKSKDSLMQQALEDGSLESQLQATEALIQNNHPLPTVFYFQLVLRGRREVFARIFAYAPISFALLFHYDMLSLAKSPDASPSPLLEAYVSLLDLAYRHKHLGLFSDLLTRHGANPNFRLITGETLMHRIAAEGETVYAEMMLKAGADLNVLSLAEMSTAIPSVLAFKTMSKTHNTMIKKIQLKEFTLAREIGKTRQQTPLGLAIYYGQLEMVKWLLVNGASHSISGSAIYYGQLEMVKWLLVNGASHSISGSSGFNAMHIAILGTQCTDSDSSEEKKALDSDIILTLLEHKASIDEISVYGAIKQTPLSAICTRGDLKIVKILVEQFAADPNVSLGMSSTLRPTLSLTKALKALPTDYEFFNPFSLAVTANHQPVALYLLSQDIQPLTQQTLALASATAKSIANSNPAIKIAIENNLVKLTLLDSAQAAFINRDFSGCLALCDQAAQVKTKQYTLRLSMLYIQAYIFSGNHEEKEIQMRHYLAKIDSQKKQILNPNAGIWEEHESFLQAYDAYMKLGLSLEQITAFSSNISAQVPQPQQEEKAASFGSPIGCSLTDKVQQNEIIEKLKNLANQAPGKWQKCKDITGNFAVKFITEDEALAKQINALLKQRSDVLTVKLLKAKGKDNVIFFELQFTDINQKKLMQMERLEGDSIAALSVHLNAS